MSETNGMEALLELVNVSCQPSHPSEGSTWKNSHSEVLGNNVTAECQQLPTAPSPLVWGRLKPSLLDISEKSCHSCN